MLVVIPCGMAKRRTPSRAADLYIGAYFRSCLRYARSIAPDDRILILSGQYGFVGLDQTIAPYQQRLGEPGAISRATLREQISRRGLLNEQNVIVIGGRAYVAACRSIWPHAAAPLAGLGGVGYQRGWLRENMGRMP